MTTRTHYPKALTAQRQYNTTTHTHKENSNILPTIQHPAPDEPPWILLAPWFILIVFSQGQADAEVQRILLRSTFIVQLIPASQKGPQMSHLAKDDVGFGGCLSQANYRGDLLEGSIAHKRLFVQSRYAQSKDVFIGGGGRLC